MKSCLKTIESLLAICLLTISAQATTLFTDNFESYPISTIPIGITNDTTVWIAHSGTNGIYVVADPTGISAKALQVSQPLAQDVHANIDTNKVAADITITNVFGPFTTNILVGVGGYTNIYGTSTNYTYAFSSSNSVAVLYSSFTIYVTTVPTGAGQYFGMFYYSSGAFVDRLFIVTNGIAPGSGNFRVALQNSGTAVTNTIPVDLTKNTAYTIVTRYILGSGQCEAWLNPANESSVTNIIPLDSTGSGNVLAYAFRQASANSGGTLDVDNVMVGTKFADVVPGSLNAPTIVTQPNDTNVFASSSAIFNTFALGDDTIGYQWFSITNGVTNGITGASGKSLTLTSLTTNQTGSIFCVITNGAGTNITRLAQLLVSPAPIPPTIDTNITPVSSANIIGDTVAFTVVAHGLPALAYQWKFVPATNSLVTNNVVGVFASGTNTATLTLTGISTNQAGSYFVTITNIVGTNTSAKAVLTVSPPPFLTIAALRSLVDPITYAVTNGTSLFTVQGIVTTWTNMTSGSSPEFYIQDSTAGVAVFWSGASISNMPPAGTMVRVTAPFEFPIFDGLLAMNPVFTNSLESVTIISTNNPLPTAQPLPFDPNMQNNISVMQSLVGSYFVASNVFLNLSSPTFVANANDPTTNIAYNILSDTNALYNYTFTNDLGQTFIVFVNAQTDIPNQTKPTGPVTIYGVLGQFVKNAPYTGGYELTPSRFADIISYAHYTNVISNARKGDLATNSYTENVIRPGESLITHVSIGDAAGGSVTLTPIGSLPTGASWTGITSGSTATAVLQYTGNETDAGNNFPIQLNVTSTAGTSFTETFSVYVPNDQEQAIVITEFLANPTTNPAAAFYNPLARSAGVNGISTNDQYIEIVNQSPNDLGGLFTLDTGTATQPVFRSLDGAGATLSSSNSLVVYGGLGTNNLTPGLSAPVSDSRGLFLPTSGSGVIVLRNSAGNIIDRVAYSASDLSTNGSLSRFPTWNSAFVPQAYISTNLTTAGLQYDGGSWSNPTKVPVGVNNVNVSVTNNQAVLKFTANTGQASTLWRADNLTDTFKVIFGQQFLINSATFVETNLPIKRFYFITTQ